MFLIPLQSLGQNWLRNKCFASFTVCTVLCDHIIAFPKWQEHVEHSGQFRGSVIQYSCSQSCQLHPDFHCNLHRYAQTCVITVQERVLGKVPKLWSSICIPGAQLVFLYSAQWPAFFFGYHTLSETIIIDEKIVIF